MPKKTIAERRNFPLSTSVTQEMYQQVMHIADETRESQAETVRSLIQLALYKLDSPKNRKWKSRITEEEAQQ